MLATQQLFLTASLLCFLTFLVLLSVTAGGVPGMRELLLASVLGMAGNVLYAFGRALPPPIAYEVTNVVYAAAGAALVAGYRHLMAYPPREGVLAAGVVALGALVALFHGVVDSFVGRGAVVSLFQIAVCGGIARTILAPRGRWPLPFHGRCFVLATCVVVTLGHVGWMALVLVSGQAQASPPEPGAWGLVCLGAVALALPALAGGGLLLAHRRIVQRAEHAAHRDYLTDAPSRKAFFEIAVRELARSRRSGRPLALALFVLDHFETLNEGHGHGAGDAALRLLVDAATGTLRGADCLARLGGDEFAVLLPDTDLAGASATADKLQAAVRRAFAASPALAGRPAPTLSIGVTTVGRNEEFKAAMTRADEALYEAKAAGRNRVAARAHTPQVMLAHRGG
jgi:diguanylate cyclase (GGDEF)-like protein